MHKQFTCAIIKPQNNIIYKYSKLYIKPTFKAFTGCISEKALIKNMQCIDLKTRGFCCHISF
uniref:Uncharacterized protein n=1 Tax=Anguilla anguilla TaxID=7936 RepID=A0A0E9WZV3_ANGAN